MVGRCIEGYQGEIEELILSLFPSENSSMVGLAPALRRLKVIRFIGGALTAQHIRELSGVAAECDTLEEFCYKLSPMFIDDLKAICQLLFTFPSLKRVTNCYEGDLREEDRFKRRSWKCSEQARPSNKCPHSDIATLKRKQP